MLLIPDANKITEDKKEGCFYFLCVIFYLFSHLNMSNTYEKVLNVISKPPAFRQDFEIQTLMPWLRKQSQLFSQLKTGKMPI